MNPLTKVAIVTGASRGIGAAIAKKLASTGIIVIVNYTSNSEAAQQVVQDIESKGGRAHPFQADVANAEDVTRLFDETIAMFGGVDYLINNAGVMPASMPKLEDTDDATFEYIFNVNVKGTFNTMREAAKKLHVGGRIVNFSSSVVSLLPPGYTAYGASKAAVETMSAIFAREMRGRNITVNTVAPGPTATELFLNGKSEETVEKLAMAAPLERIGQPEEIASVVAFLLSEEGGWINAQTIRVNGGIV